MSNSREAGEVRGKKRRNARYETRNAKKRNGGMIRDPLDPMALAEGLDALGEEGVEFFFEGWGEGGEGEAGFAGEGALEVRGERGGVLGVGVERHEVEADVVFLEDDAGDVGFLGWAVEDFDGGFALEDQGGLGGFGGGVFEVINEFESAGVFFEEGGEFIKEGAEVGHGRSTVASASPGMDSGRGG